MEELFSLNRNLCTPPETDSEKELPPTPDMSPIVKPIEFESSLPLKEAEIKVVSDKTQNIILELLLNSAEIYLVQEELARNKENIENKSKKGYGKESKGNKLKAPYKDRPSKNKLQRRNEKPYHNKNPKESIYYKERMVKKKTTVRICGKERKQKMKADDMKKKEKKRGIVKWIRMSFKETK